MAPRDTETMLMQNFGVTNKEHYGMLWYFLEWSIKVSESHTGEFTFYFKPSFCRRRRPRVLRSKKTAVNENSSKIQ